MTKNRETMSIDGLKELDKALGAMPASTGKNVLRRVGKKAGQPIYDHFQRIAPRGTTDRQHMADSGGVSTKLSRRQARAERKRQKDTVTIYIGPGPDPAAVQQEFGNINHGPQPSLTIAFEREKRNALEIIKTDLGKEIKRAAERLARKQARLAAKAVG